MIACVAKALLGTVVAALLLGPFTVAAAATGDVGRFEAGVKAFNTLNYWVEGDAGLVLIDTQFLPSDAVKSLQAAEAATGKKVTHAIVLHANPDKFNGTAALQARGVKVLTSREVKALLPGVHAMRLGWFYNDYQPDYPSELPAPTAFAEDEQVLAVHGLTLKLHRLGAGASAAHVVVQYGDTLFVGDLLASASHAWTELGEIDEWLKRIEELRALSPKRIFVGRGPAGNARMLDDNANYLKNVRAAIRQAASQTVFEWVGKFAAKRAITLAYPGYGWAGFLDDGMPALWARYGTKNSANN